MSSTRQHSIRLGSTATGTVSKRLVDLLGCCCFLALLSGCTDPKWQWNLPPDSDRTSSATQPAGERNSALASGPVRSSDAGEQVSDVQARTVSIQSIEFRVLRVRGPRGVFSESGKIWNPLNEEVIPAARQVLLQQNGLRLGLGMESSWPQIEALLEAEKVEVFQNQTVCQNGLPLFLETEQPPRDHTLFMFRPDGTMPGATFPLSTLLLRIEYTISLEHSDAMILEVMPEIRLQRAPPQGQFTPEGWVEQPTSDPSRPLRELTARVTVGEDGFLALGPSPMALKGHLPGSLLLCEERDGELLESMYFVIPRLRSLTRESQP